MFKYLRNVVSIVYTDSDVSLETIVYLKGLKIVTDIMYTLSTENFLEIHKRTLVTDSS